MIKCRRCILSCHKSWAKVSNRNDISTFEIGKAADIAIFDLSGPEYIGALTDPLTALLICGHNHKAKDVIINGKIVVKNFILETVDFEKIKKIQKIISTDCIQNKTNQTQRDLHISIGTSISN